MKIDGREVVTLSEGDYRVIIDGKGEGDEVTEIFGNPKELREKIEKAYKNVEESLDRLYSLLTAL